MRLTQYTTYQGHTPILHVEVLALVAELGWEKLQYEREQQHLDTFRAAWLSEVATDA